MLHLPLMNVHAHYKSMLTCFLSLWVGCQVHGGSTAGVRVGVASVGLDADDGMPIAGGIHPGKAQGQEGELRAVAMVLEKSGVRLALIAVDILMLSREILDEVTRDIEHRSGIPFEHILIHATHTHHAPSTLRLHDYQADPVFTARVHRAIVESVVQAIAQLSEAELNCFFKMGREDTVGVNSRQLLPDGSIYWIGRREFVRPTGPFDPQLPVMGFKEEPTKGSTGNWRAVWFNHSTHTIGTLRSGVRSPSFYGLAAQSLERELGGKVLFLEGASGSTHNLRLSAEEAKQRIIQAVDQALGASQRMLVHRLASIKRPFSYRVRHFDEAAEQEAVASYCRKWIGPYGLEIIPVFESMRATLSSQQGEPRQSWIQAMAIGEVALVGVPAELFTSLGMEIKRRSPFAHTVVAELSNDWIGYLPDRQAHQLGGYQVWTGFHSYCEPGTGERMVEEALDLLDDLHAIAPAWEEKP